MGAFFCGRAGGIFVPMPIVEHVLKAKAFLEATRGRVVLDVRSPKNTRRATSLGPFPFHCSPTTNVRLWEPRTSRLASRKPSMQASVLWVPNCNLSPLRPGTCLKVKHLPNHCSSTAGAGACAAGVWIGSFALPKSRPCVVRVGTKRVAQSTTRFWRPAAICCCGRNDRVRQSQIIHSLKRMGEGVVDLEGWPGISVLPLAI